ncbi:MAG TPA: acetyl-CoA carboxylase, biotin carboxyl carrier protein, partial [Exiguobacterium sp.]|nr:acetyl-CoA carboxylase, biotin carboxyl carrier protein [Exiguobacterium sp.]
MKIDQLKQVLEMLDQSSVNELSLETDTYKLKLKKQGETVTVSHQAP